MVRRARLAPALVVTGLWVLGAPGCENSDSPCMQVDPCPTVDQDPTSGDYVFPADVGGSVGVGLALGDAGPQPSSPPSGFPVGGEIVFTPASDGSGAITLKRLQLQFPDFQVSFGAGPVTVSGASIQFATPIAIAPTAPTVGGGYVDFLVPAGTVVHTCATIDGKAWHGSAATTEPFDIEHITSPSSPGVVSVRGGTFPVVLRTDDARCDPSTLQGSVAGVFDTLTVESDVG